MANIRLQRGSAHPINRIAELLPWNTPSELLTPPLDPELKSRAQPAASGRQVRTGIRQSIPFNSMPSCAGVSTTPPSAGDGGLFISRPPLGAWVSTGARA